MAYRNRLGRLLADLYPGQEDYTLDQALVAIEHLEGWE